LELQISPTELAALRQNGPVRLLDIRSREEFEATRIEGAVLFSQPVMQEILGHWPRTELVIIYDHRGRQSPDAAAFLLGHQFTQVRCLRGGIDAWSVEVDPAVRRYELEYSA
jgi:rhodanese-related sulfurtransferase